MSMPLHALGFYSPQTGSGRATVNRRIYPTRVAPRRSLATAADVMANVTMKLMGEDSDQPVEAQQ